MSTDAVLSQKSVQSLLDELIAALYLRPWIDEPEERHKLNKEIIKRARADKSSIASLVKLLKHPDWAVRCDVAEMLGWIRNTDATKPLLEILWTDRMMTVRGSVALALERIGTPEALATSQEYASTIRSYPEIIGRVAELAERQGVTTPEVFDVAMRSQIQGVRIEDTLETGQGIVLGFELCDLLAIIGHQARISQWCCRGVKCTGEYASEMQAVSDQGLIVSGRTFAHIALMLDQTTEGEFVALRDDAEAWLVIRAANSLQYEVWSREPEVLEQIRSHFQHVENVELGRAQHGVQPPRPAAKVEHQF